METYEQQTFLDSEELPSSVPGSLASQLLSPGSEEARRMLAGSGRQLSTLLNASNPLGRFSRILLESSAFGNSKQFCYVWRILDTKFACSAFQLTPLAQTTSDSGCSLLPTAMSNDWKGPNMSGSGTASCNSLSTWAAKLWPTPTVPNGGRRNPPGTSITGQKPDGGKAQIDLREFAIRMLPTPTSRDYKAGTAQSCQNVPVNGLLGRAVHHLLPTPQAHDAAKGDPARVNRFGTEHGGRNLNDEMGGSLNPEFVEWLMGYPVGWTECRNLSQKEESKIDHTALKPLEIASVPNRPRHSSRRSRKLKGGAK